MIKVEKDLINYIILKENIETICPWLISHHFKLHHHIYVLPKFTRLYGVMQMIEQYNGSRRVEVVITLQDDIEVDMVLKSLKRYLDIKRAINVASNNIDFQSLNSQSSYSSS